MTSLRALALVVSLVVAASAAAVRNAAGEDRSGGALPPRVRGGDALAIEVLQSAIRLSPTVARLVAELEGTDLIVIIETGRLPERIAGQVRIAAATASVRYLRVTLKIPGSKTSLMKTLGHELCHAVEIAHMPQVRDDEGLAESYRRVGIVGERDGYFETESAVATGLLVAREVGLTR